MNDRQNGPIVRTAFNTIGPNGLFPAGAYINNGQVPGSRMAFSANPSNTNPFQIGAATFQFVTALAAATTFTQIKILGSAALTLAATLDAINGVTNANVVPGSTLATQMAAVPVVADAPTATTLRIRAATKQGGAPLAGVVASTALTCTITAGASAWSATNLNQGGKVGTDVQSAGGAHTVMAGDLTAGFMDFEFEFQPTLFDFWVQSSTGLNKTITELGTLPASQKSLHVTAGTGATPVVAGDVVNYWVGA